MEQYYFFSHLAGVFSSVFASDLLRYVIGAGGVYLIVNLALATRLRRRKIRADDPPRAQIRRELVASVRTVLIFALNGTLIVLGAEVAVIPIYGEISDYGWVYLVVSTALLIILHDAWFYWSHRVLHYPPLFRRFHRLHHRSHNPTPFTSYSFDVGEAVVNAIYLPLVLLALPAHPLAILTFVTHMMLRNAIGHSGYELFPANRQGKPLFGWMTTVTHHDLHHAHAGYNLGLYFTWWDRWMGTEHPEYHTAFRRVAQPVTAFNLRIIVLSLAILAGLGVTNARAEGLTGTYASPGLGIIVRFEPCSGAPDQTCGRIVWAWSPKDLAHARVGDVVVTGLRRDGGGWTGQLKSPENGRSYRGSLTQKSAEEIVLRGCSGPFCTSQTWRSVRSLLQVLKAVN